MIKYVISDMDGVIYRGKSLIPGVNQFLQELKSRSIPFLFLTNNSEQTPIDLARKLDALGIHNLKEENFITSAMATATFLATQSPRSTAFVIGGGGLISELYNVGYSITENNPEYVVVGKTTAFNYDLLKKATRLINAGAKFIATNPDVLDPTESGPEPACGTLIAAILAATGKAPYVVGKPNPLMMSFALKKLGAHPEESIMIGDRMDTDVIAGMEAGMKTCLVLSGVSDKETTKLYPYRPDYIFESVAHLDFTEVFK